MEEHFRKQKRLKAAGIKVLSLFFIDRVENFVGDPPADKSALERGRPVSRHHPRAVRRGIRELKGKYPDFADKKAAEVRGSYFAKKKRRGGEEDASIRQPARARKTAPPTT